MTESPGPGLRIGDLVAVSRAPAVVSLSDVARLRDRLACGEPCTEELASLLAEYHLGEEQTRLAFEAMLRSLGRSEERGDAFSVAGVYGSGKSHLLAVLALLCGHPQAAWPAFLEGHPQHARAAVGFPQPRLVVPIPLDEYPSPSHPLEQIVFSSLERELAQRHGVRVALTEDSHLVRLVFDHVLPRFREELNAAAGTDWETLGDRDPAAAAQSALAVIERTGFPLDWRRSRAEAWGALRTALGREGLDGPVLLLDELGLFLAAKDRRGLNADASFLQYLAQLTGAERCWVVCVTQRGLEEAGDVDRRTLRQMRDRFRAAFALDLSDLRWIVEHRLIRKRDAGAFAAAMDRLCHGCGSLLAPEEAGRSYPLNPLCLTALQRAAEAGLSRTRSVVRLLQEAALQRGWLDLPADRLITPDAAFDLFADELAHHADGRRVLDAIASVQAHAARIAPGRERQVVIVLKALGLLCLAGLRWPFAELRASLVGCEEPEVWRDPDRLRALLRSLYRRGAFVARRRAGGGGDDEYFLDITSAVTERLRQRMGELLGEMAVGDTRVPRAALEVCADPAFPLAALADTRTAALEWLNARRYVSAACRDLSSVAPAELRNLSASLAAPLVREDGALFIALPLEVERQEASWCEVSREAEGRFAAALLAWLPRPLEAQEEDHLREHAALARMLADPTLTRRRDVELRTELRARWEESERETRDLVQKAYFEGRIVGPAGRVVVAGERLRGFVGDWDGLLSAAFADALETIFPRFASIAPERRLAGRAQTNQLIDQFIRPGEVHLPPASALEAYLSCYARPLGLVRGQEREFALALGNGDLVALALSAVPARLRPESLTADDAVPFGELAGRLAKSEWGVVREQTELLVAALLRTGHLVPLDAFLQPLRFEMVAAPLSDFLPYVVHAAPLDGAAAEAARLLHAAVCGAPAAVWDLPAQEQAWRELVHWSARTQQAAPEHREAVARAAEALGHDPEDWAPSIAFLARVEVIAQAVNPHLIARDGLHQLVQAAARLPGGAEASAEAIGRWRQCERFLGEWAADLASSRRLVAHESVRCPAGSLLAREREEVLAWLGAHDRLMADPAGARGAAQRWLEAYRRHYLAWHERAHAAARFEPLAQLRRSPALEAARRLTQAGLSPSVADVDEDLRGAAGRRCLAGDPLPDGHVVCPLCGLLLGEDPPLPEGTTLSARVQSALGSQLWALRGQAELLLRRLRGCEDRRVVAAVQGLFADGVSPQAVCDLLTDDTVSWLRGQLGQPHAVRKELRSLTERLTGKELPKREVRRAVEAWLGEGEEQVVEILWSEGGGQEPR
jgi:hypothetical protein